MRRSFSAYVSSFKRKERQSGETQEETIKSLLHYSNQHTNTLRERECLDRLVPRPADPQKLLAIRLAHSDSYARLSCNPSIYLFPSSRDPSSTQVLTILYQFLSCVSFCLQFLTQFVAHERTVYPLQFSSFHLLHSVAAVSGLLIFFAEFVFDPASTRVRRKRGAQTIQSSKRDNRIIIIIIISRSFLTINKTKTKTK